LPRISNRKLTLSLFKYSSLEKVNPACESLKSNKMNNKAVKKTTKLYYIHFVSMDNLGAKTIERYLERGMEKYNLSYTHI
jgi:hypothetical protein